MPVLTRLLLLVGVLVCLLASLVAPVKAVADEPPDGRSGYVGDVEAGTRDGDTVTVGVTQGSPSSNGSNSGGGWVAAEPAVPDACSRLMTGARCLPPMSGAGSIPGRR